MRARRHRDHPGRHRRPAAGSSNQRRLRGQTARSCRHSLPAMPHQANTRRISEPRPATRPPAPDMLTVTRRPAGQHAAPAPPGNPHRQDGKPGTRRTRATTPPGDRSPAPRRRRNPAATGVPGIPPHPMLTGATTSSARPASHGNPARPGPAIPSSAVRPRRPALTLESSQADDPAGPAGPSQAGCPPKWNRPSPDAGRVCCPQIYPAPPADAPGRAMLPGEPPDRRTGELR